MKALALLLIVAVAAIAQPTVGTPSVVSGTLTQNSVQLLFTAAPDSYCWARYGLSTGSYTRSATGFASVVGSCYVTLANLTAGTQYFVQAVGYPIFNSTSSQGFSAEINFTTPAATPITIPTQPAAFVLPTYPDTSGYTTVPLTPIGSGYDNCGLQNAINNAAFGTIIEIPQGSVCNTTDLGFGINAGPYLKPKAVQAGKTMNDPTHQWIIIRTARTPLSLPPDGARTSPAYSGILGQIRAVDRTSGGRGASLNAETGLTDDVHHYWIDNIEFTFPNGIAADSQDPAPYGAAAINLTNNFAAQATAGNIRWVVVDRVLMVPPAAPFRLSYAANVILEGANVELRGSYFGPLGYWKAFADTIPAATRVGNTITQLATGSWQRKTTESAWAPEGTVTAALTASGGYSGAYVMYLNGSGVFVDYTTPTGGETASWACTNCTATAVASPAVPDSSHYLAAGAIASGIITTMTAWNPCSWSTCEGSVGLLTNTGPGPLRFDNNFISSPLIGFYSDALSNAPTGPNDLYFTRNDMDIPSFMRWNSPDASGWFFQNRNIWETKRGKRWLIKGNTFTGQFGQATSSGAGIVWSPRLASDVPATFEVGIADQTFQYNTVSDSSAAIYVGGLDEISGIRRPPLTRNIWIEGNIFNNIDGLTYTTNTSGALFANIGSPINTFCGFENLVFRFNTYRRSRGMYPSVGFYCATSSLLNISNNVMSVSAGDTTDIAGFTTNATPLLSNYPGVPFIANTVGNFAATLAASSGNAVVGNNAYVCGKIRSGTYPAVTDLSSAQCTTIASTWPVGGNVFAPGATEVARETAAGLLSDGRLTYASPYRSYAGADIANIYAAQGVVTSVSYTVTASAVTVTFRAPDTAQCSVDWSADGGSTFPEANRVASTGSGRAKVATFAATTRTVYSLRLICASETVTLKVRTL
jgi:hypothetical protein